MSIVAKGLHALLAVLQKDPFAVDFVKLAEASPVLLEEVKRQPRISKVLAIATWTPSDFWILVSDEALIDWAYRFRRFGLKRLPPKKNAEPYQIISKDDYDKLVNPREYIIQHLLELSEEQKKKICDEAEKRKEGVGLHYSNEKFFNFELRYENCIWLMWLAKNFTMREDRPIILLTFLATQRKLSLMKEIYEGYRDKIDWNAEMRALPLDRDHPFYASLTQDRAPVAVWLAETFDMSQRLGQPQARDLFRSLVTVNNVDAIKWLVRKYALPPTQVISLSHRARVRLSIGEILWVMAASGRRELATFLSRHYDIPFVKFSLEERGIRTPNWLWGQSLPSSV